MKEFDPKHAARHGYTRADWEGVDAPEATEDQLAQARPFAEAFPDIAGQMRKAIGRPKSDNPKVSVSLRLDHEVVARFKASGSGWQSRMNSALRQAAGLPVGK